MCWIHTTETELRSLIGVTIWAGGFTQKITKQYIWRITIGERSVGYRRSMGRDAWPSRREGTAELSLNSV